MDLYEVCSIDGPGVQNGPAAGVIGFLQNCLAQVLKIRYVALPGGPLPSFFK